MKKIFFSRKAILRAIHAACVALYLLAAQREAAAQSYTLPFQVSGSTVTTASGSYGTGSGFYEPSTTYSSLSIGAGTSINSTASYGGNGSAYNTPSSLITAATSTFSNAGTLSLSGTYGAGSSTFQAVVNLNEGATSLTATNTGTISGNLTGGGPEQSRDEAFLVQSTSGNVSITNSGSILLPAGTYYGDLITVLAGTTGNVSVTNTESGVLSSSTSNNGSGIQVYDPAFMSYITGTVTILNAGTITGPNLTVGVDVSSEGPIDVTNTGSISVPAAYYGIEVYGTTVSVNNSGSINGGSSSGIYAGGNEISVTNSGTITNSGSAIYVGQYPGPAPITVVNSGTITNSTYGIKVGYATTGSAISLTNSGSISVTNSGIYSAVVANVTNSGNITAPTAMNLPSGSSVTLTGRPIINGTIIGGATSASTSTLAFNLTIPSANLAAAQAQLSTEIAAYAAQNGGNYTFTVDGLTYDVSNFAYNGITDDLGGGGGQPPSPTYAYVPGFYSEGTVLDNLNPNNPQAAAILNALANVPEAGLVNALSELSPKELQIFRNVANNDATFLAAKINNHLANLRDGLTGFDSTALSVQDSGMDPTLNQVRDHLLAYNPAATPGLINDSADSFLGVFDAKDMKSAEVNTMPLERWSTFIAGDVVLAQLSHNANLEDSDYTTGNVTAGVDYRLDDHFTVGALFAYAHTDADLDSRGSSATVDSYSPGIYASYVDKGWYGNGLATYGRNSYTSDRMTDIPGLAGDNTGATSGNQGTANLTGGYEFQRGAFKFGPVASVQYVHLSVDSTQEQGPAALSIASQDEDSFRSQLGVEGRFAADVATPFGRMSLTPHVSASWQHEYLDDSRGINAQFSGTGGGSFVTQTDNPDRDSAFIDAGLDASVSKNVTVFVDYEVQAGQSDFFGQSAEGGVRIGF